MVRRVAFFSTIQLFLLIKSVNSALPTETLKSHYLRNRVSNIREKKLKLFSICILLADKYYHACLIIEIVEYIPVIVVFEGKRAYFFAFLLNKL